VRAKVEHVFAVVKRQWGFTKVRYRGLAKKGDAPVRGACAGESVFDAATVRGITASKVREAPDSGSGKERKTSFIVRNLAFFAI
jgi:hypothetical protein